jgi:hypothetical protein
LQDPKRGNILLGPGIDLGNVADEVDHTAGVAPLVVVPRDQLDEVVVERDTGLGIKDGGVSVASQVRRDNFIFSVRKDTYFC